MIKVLAEFSEAKHFQLQVFLDHRGSFLKIFRESVFREQGWPTDWKEQYVSSSKPGVLRGLHFQTPPFQHDKMVILLSGKVVDAVVDLRQSSATYGRHSLYALEPGQGVLVPKGFAHGFAVTGDQDATLLYSTTTEHAPSHDSGVLWNTLGIDWPVRHVITSERDNSFPKFSDFKTPFY
jgi:dTDP-4-dehydrorhamnose 3,5-epimerase